VKKVVRQGCRPQGEGVDRLGKWLARMPDQRKWLARMPTTGSGSARMPTTGRRSGSAGEVVGKDANHREWLGKDANHREWLGKGCQPQGVARQRMPTSGNKLYITKLSKFHINL
jgi:hypothetical protein